MPKGFSATAKREGLIFGGSSADSTESQKLLTAYYQTITENRVSQQATLLKVEAEITKNSYETCIIVDADGFVLAAYKGGKSSVNLGKDYNLAKGNLITHNHPSGLAVLSVGDIRYTGKLGGIGVRAATKRNGTAVLSKASNRPKWGDFADAYERFLEPGRTARQARTWLFKNASDYGLKFTIERRS